MLEQRFLLLKKHVYRVVLYIQYCVQYCVTVKVSAMPIHGVFSNFFVVLGFSTFLYYSSNIIVVEEVPKY